METVTVRIRRYDPTSDVSSKLEEFTIPYQEGMRILDALLYIYEGVDHSLAFRYSCKIGNCKICLMKANGKTVYACQERLEDGMVLEPLSHFEDIRDLVCGFKKKVASGSADQ
jgi:succinate dehydrogenase/fumarate reductase iron-sulfur protein